jgi:acyl carrier protein
MELVDKIARIVRENSEIKMVVGPETDLKRDLDIDSFGTIMIMNAIEDEFGITADEADFAQVSTVSDMARLLENKYLTGRETANEQH